MKKKTGGRKSHWTVPLRLWQNLKLWKRWGSHLVSSSKCSSLTLLDTTTTLLHICLFTAEKIYQKNLRNPGVLKIQEFHFSPLTVNLESNFVRSETRADRIRIVFTGYWSEHVVVQKIVIKKFYLRFCFCANICSELSKFDFNVSNCW